VSRSLAACEGALLVVDASQGVEAQTVANCYTAIEQGVEVIPVLNKIDLPSADAEKAIQEIEDVIGIQAKEALRVSAKTGENVPEALEAVIARIPAPSGDSEARLKALVIDSWFDNYVGVVMLVRMVDGTLKPRDRLLLMSTGAEHVCEQVGVFTPKSTPREQLSAGEVGFVVAGVKELREAKIGDTMTSADHPADEPLPGFKEIKPQVFAGLYPVESNQYEGLRDALGKLHLNDASFHYEPETSMALGFGFRCGFLGLLHMDIVQERLEREYGMQLITTAPSVIYEVQLRDGTLQQVSNPARLPDPSNIVEIREPVIATTIFVPHEVRRTGDHALHAETRHADQPALLGAARRSVLRPAAQRGGDGFLRPVEVVDARLRVPGLRVQGVPRRGHGEAGRARERRERSMRSRAWCTAHPHSIAGATSSPRLRSIIPRQMFDVAVQAAIGSHIIARETVKALRKNVLAKCYGGDITRKRKLLEKQKAGKKRMKQVGSVEIPQEAFLAVLQTGDK
jgi:GTP-binding protein LepA